MNISDFDQKCVLKRYTSGERDIVLMDVGSEIPTPTPFVTWNVGPDGTFSSGDYCYTQSEAIRSFADRVVSVIYLP